jgi:hypothetical protein
MRELLSTLSGRRWRFRAWPEGEWAELVDVLEATPEEQAAALPAARAWWLLEHGALTSAAGGDSFALARLLRDVGVEIAGGRPERWHAPIERAVRTGRLLVVVAAYKAPRVEPGPVRVEPPFELGLDLLPRG